MQRVALITGASGGIGEGIARALASKGFHLALGARRVDRLEELKSSLLASQPDLSIFVDKLDVTNRAEFKEFVKNAEASLGNPISVLVNNAGVMSYTYMKNLKEDEWELTVDVNCKGVLNGVGAVLDGMLQRGNGHIVNISSDAGRKAFVGLAVYSGSKFFVEGFSQALRLETAGKGIRVTTIQPGDVNSELTTRNQDVDSEAYSEFVGSGSSENRVLDPNNIGDAVVYAVCQPSHVAVNEILVEPAHAPA